MGKVSIESIKEEHDSCNCCSLEEIMARDRIIFRIGLRVGGHTQIIKLCEVHAKELKTAIEEEI